MRNYIFIIICSISLGISCGEKANQSDATLPENNEINIPEPEQSNTEIKKVEETKAEPAPPPPRSEKRVANEKKESSKSKFLNLGCCQTESERLKDCCCLAVLEKYTAMRNSNDPKLGEYKMKDPILGNCRRTLPKAFDLVDHPPTTPEEESDDFF